MKLELSRLETWEPYICRVVDGTLRDRNIVLSYHRREDLVAFCVSELWIASRDFDQGRYGHFGQFANKVVRRRLIDWLRIDLGRTKWQFAESTFERERPRVLSFDAPNGDGDVRLGDSLAAPEGGLPSDHWADVLLREVDQRHLRRAIDKSALNTYLLERAA